MLLCGDLLSLYKLAKKGHCLRDFGLPLRRKWVLRSSGTLHSLNW